MSGTVREGTSSNPASEAGRGGAHGLALGAGRNRTLSQQMADELIQRILLGEFEAGESLPSEDELAAHYSVSRPVIREAVKQLLQLGLVKSRQGRATRVEPSSEWNHFAPSLLLARGRVGAVDDILLELLELRRLIETGAAGLAAVRATPEAIESIRAALERMEHNQTDLDEFVDADISFHQAVLAATGNYLLSHLIDMIEPLLRLGRRMSLQRRVDGPAASQHGHQQVFAAIRDHDPEAARAAMREHLSWTAELQVEDVEGA